MIYDMIYYVTNKRGDCQKKGAYLRWICVPQCRKSVTFATPGAAETGNARREGERGSRTFATLKLGLLYLMLRCFCCDVTQSFINQYADRIASNHH